MNAGVGLEIDLVVLLDFEPTLPCEGDHHPRGLSGHDPTAPGAFLVVGPCGPKVIQCLPRVNHMKTIGELYCRPCDRQHPITDYRFIPIGQQ